MDISERLKIAQQLAFLQAGGGKKTGAEEFANLFSSLGGAAKTAGEGFASGQEARKKAMEAEKLQIETQKLQSAESPLDVQLGLKLPSQSQENAAKAKRDAAVAEVMQGRPASEVPPTPEEISAHTGTQPFVSEREAFTKQTGVPPGGMNLEDYYKLQHANVYRAASAGLVPVYRDRTTGEIDIAQTSNSDLVGNVPQVVATKIMATKANAKTMAEAKGDIPKAVERAGAIATAQDKAHLKSGIKDAQTQAKDIAREDRINRTILNYTESLENNNIVKELNKQGNFAYQMDSLIDLVKNGNTIAFSALGTKTAKAMGEVGVLTESDISRYVRSGRLDRKAADTLSKWVKGNPTEATLNEIQQISNVLQDSNKTRVQPIYDRYINRLSENLGMTKEEASKRLDVPYTGEQIVQPQQEKFKIGDVRVGENGKKGTYVGNGKWAIHP